MLLILVLAVCLARVQYLTTRHNMKAKWNGYGAIVSTLDKSADAPMAYRVLVPWLIGKDAPVWKYEAARFLLILGALGSVYLAWGRDVMVITAGLLTITFYFDYWDWAAELIGLSLALVSLPLALVGVVLYGTSRETAPLAGLVYALHTGDAPGGAVVGMVGLLVLLVVRMIQGEHPLYCKRWMHKENFAMLKGAPVVTGQWSIYFSVLVCVLGLAGAILAGAQGHWDGLIVPALIGAGWTMAKANETRVFTGVLPYAAIALLSL